MSTTAFALLSLGGLLPVSAPTQQGGPVRDARPWVRSSDWSILGPFDNPAGTAVDVDVGPDRFVKRMEAGKTWVALDESFLGRDRKKLIWRRARAAPVEARAGSSPFDSGELDIARLLGVEGEDTARAVAFLYREIHSREERTVSIACGSDDGLRLWLNGELLVDRAEPRVLNPYDDRVTLHLEEGRNHLLAKVTNQDGPWSFAMLAPEPVQPPEIDVAIDRGVAWLLDRQLYDGSWAGEQESYRSGMTGLVAFTLLQSGVSPRHRAILQALEHLSAIPAERTYSVACHAMALAAAGDPARKPELERLVQQLLSWQESSGGWSYPGIHADLSNTQFATVALHAAANVGIEVPAKAWNEIVDFTFRHRESRHRNRMPGFSYLPADTATGSMTCAGIAVLAIARDALGERLQGKSRAEVGAAIEEGLAWLEANWSVSRNPRKGDYHLNYLYGLERVCALLGLDQIGEHDWYAEGAQWLVRSQGAAGDWKGAEADTCFALLFLERATRRPQTLDRSTEAAAVRSTPVGSGGLRLHVRPGTSTELWIDPPALGAGVELARLEFRIRRPTGDWTAVFPDESQPLAARYALPDSGTWEVQAAAQLSDGTRLDSVWLAVSNDEGLSPARIACARSAVSNRLPQYFPAVTSSSAADGSPGANATDNRSWTRWLCARDDTAPWIDVELVRPTMVARLTFAHARTTRAESAAANPRPTRIALWIDGGDTPRRVELDPDPQAQSIVEFTPPITLTTFRIEIEGLVDGTLGTAEVGFSEIGLERPETAAPGTDAR